MQDIVQSSSDTKQGLAAAAPAFEKSMIVKWRLWGRFELPPVVITIIALVSISQFSVAAAAPPTQQANFENFHPTESASGPSEYSHTTIFSLGDDDAAATDNELGKTLATSQISSIVSAGSSSTAPIVEQQPPASDRLHVIEFGDHAEPSELSALLTGGGGGGGSGVANHTAAVENNNLLKSHAGAGQFPPVDRPNRTGGGGEPAPHFSTNNGTHQQVGAESLQSATESKQSSDGGVHQQQDQTSKHSGARPTHKSRRKKKRRKLPSQQILLQQQNATVFGLASSPHQMITYVSRGQQMPSGAHHFERLLKPSQPLMARFLPASALKLALNSPLLYGQLQLADEPRQQPTLEFGRYNLAANQVVNSSRGPFELEQLQATASTRQNKKVQHSMFSHEREPSSSGHQLMQTHESNHFEQVNGELVTPTAGQPPAISDHLDEEDGGGVPSLDYETDEAGSELFASEQHNNDDGGDGDGATTLSSGGRGGASSPMRQAGQPAVVQETGSANKTTELGEVEANRQVAAQSKSSPTIQMVAAQQQRPGLKIANNELLVGPFKSEAEAPATITLAGVVYQKSGSSSALLSATPVTNNGAKQVVAANNLDSSLAPGPGQLRSERANSLVATAHAGSVPQTAAAAAAAAASTAGDWPQSMSNKMINTGSSVYLGTISQQPPGGALVPTLVGQTGGGDQSAGEQMSLSSSSTKPMTSSGKSLASQLIGSSELVLATGGSGPTTTTTSQSDLAQQLGYATGTQQVPATHATQLYQQRLPNGSIIWTLNKPGNSLMHAAASSDSASALNGAGLPFEVGVASSEPSESKHSHHKSQAGGGGPIVIVQKDVKPVKYHLLRAYLKLRRLLRPFEATYVFPGDHATAASAASTSSAYTTGTTAVLGAGGGVIGSNAFLRRRQPAPPSGSLPNLQVSRRARRWPRARRFLGGGRGSDASGRLER